MAISIFWYKMQICFLFLQQSVNSWSSGQLKSQSFPFVDPHNEPLYGYFRTEAEDTTITAEKTKISRSKTRSKNSRDNMKLIN